MTTSDTGRCPNCGAECEVGKIVMGGTSVDMHACPCVPPSMGFVFKSVWRPGEYFLPPTPVDDSTLQAIESLNRRAFESLGVPMTPTPSPMYTVKVTGPIEYSGGSGTVITGPSIVPPPIPVDPLDVEYDGVKLRDLLEVDARRRDERNPFRRLTIAQRTAVSAHWSAQLRAKVEASRRAEAERERNRVVLDHASVDPEPWGAW